MEIKQLHTFQVASSTLNFTKTAALLNYVQSSVTAQIKALEEELETPLFERLGKRLILTEAGRQLQTYANQILHLSEEAKTAINTRRQTGTLTIGAQESQCTYRLPHLLKTFKEKYPLVNLVFKPAHSDKTATEELMTGKLDLAFILDIAITAGHLTIEPLLQEKLILTASPQNALNRKPVVNTGDLQNETLLLTEEGCSYRSLFEKILRSEGVTPLNQVEFVSIEALKQCVMANLGIALLPAMVVEQQINDGLLSEIPWDTDLQPLTTKMTVHKDKRLTPALADFMQLTRDYFADLQPEIPPAHKSHPHTAIKKGN